MSGSSDGPHEVIWGPRRTRIRDDLRKFLEEAKIGAKRFTDLLAAEPEFGVRTSEAAIFRFLNPAAPTLGDTVVRAIERYLDKYVRPEWEKAEWQMPQRGDPIFEAARVFFGMGQHKVRQYLEPVSGDFRFYSYTERGKGLISCGALRLNKDFTASDQQAAAPSGAEESEEYEGHYLFRGDVAIVMLRNASKRPKFCMLAISPHPDRETGKRHVMSGVMLKSGGMRDLFSTTIHMIRDDEAFGHTAMLQRDQVDPDILKILDSPQWGPA